MKKGTYMNQIGTYNRYWGKPIAINDSKTNSENIISLHSDPVVLRLSQYISLKQGLIKTLLLHYYYNSSITIIISLIILDLITQTLPNSNDFLNMCYIVIYWNALVWAFFYHTFKWSFERGKCFIQEMYK